MEPTYTTSIENSTDLSFPPRIIALHFGIDEGRPRASADYPRKHGAADCR